MKRYWILFGTLGLFLILTVTTATCFAFYTSSGNSMNPTLKADKTVFVRNYFQKIDGTPKRGAIMVFYPPGNRNIKVVKRVVGLPGDRIEIKGGAVYVNDVRYEETYTEPGIKTQPQLSFPHHSTWKVPDDALFFLGDNRRPGASNDSRNFGCIPLADVIGFVLASF